MYGKTRNWIVRQLTPVFCISAQSPRSYFIKWKTGAWTLVKLVAERNKDTEPHKFRFHAYQYSSILPCIYRANFWPQTQTFLNYNFNCFTWKGHKRHKSLHWVYKESKVKGMQELSQSDQPVSDQWNTQHDPSVTFVGPWSPVRRYPTTR